SGYASYGSAYHAPRPLPFRTRCHFSTSCLKCFLSVLRLTPVSLVISPIVTRPCSRAYLRIWTDNSGSADNTIFSRSTFFARRFICCCSARRKNRIHGCQFGVSVRILPCV